jgi:rubredoxin
MFPIDFFDYICYYLIGICAVFFMLVLTQRRHLFDRRQFSEEQVWQCLICLYVYFETKPLAISVCPVCGSFNRRSSKTRGVA